MLRTCKLFFLSALTLGFVSSANAGVMIEPYLGYYLGKEKGLATSDFNGVGYGARLGYASMIGLNLGVEYMSGMLKEKSDPKSDLTPGSLGVFVGFDFPILLRVYATYFVMDKLTAKADGESSKLEGSKGVKLGVGFTPLPLFSVNLEYGASEFDKVDGDSISSNPLKTSYYGLSVSLPLTF